MERTSLSGKYSMENEYPVYPEQEGEWDLPRNPYSPV